MSELVWLLVPLAPLLLAALLPAGRDHLTPWLWLGCVPALAAAIFGGLASTENLTLAVVWPGAEWGALDLVSRALLAFTAVLWACAGIYGEVSQKQHPHRLRFHGLWLLSLSGNLLLIIARDGTSFYVGFTLMSLSAYGLIVHLGGPRPRQAGRLYLQLAVLGEMLLYAGLMLRIFETGGVSSFEHWQNAPVGTATAALLLVGFGLKAGFWPLHVWLPLAHPAAPAAASAVLSGAMLKAGILGIWRFLPESDPLLQTWAPTLVAVGMFSAFYGVALGLIQDKAKSALAYSSISQIGYLLAVVALAWSQPEARAAWAVLLAVYTVHHGFAKGALFLGAGLAARYSLQKRHWALMCIPAAALAGLPFTSGAAVKTLLKYQAGETAFQAWILLLSMGAMATALLVARAVWLMWRAQRELPHQTPAPPTMVAAWTVLCVLPVLLPWLWSPLREGLVATLGFAAIWKLLWPLTLAAVLTLLTLRSGWRRPEWLIDRYDPSRLAAHLLHRRLVAVGKNSEVSTQHKPKWRIWERRWNRLWQQNIFTLSAWLLLVLLLLAW